MSRSFVMDDFSNISVNLERSLQLLSEIGSPDQSSVFYSPQRTIPLRRTLREHGQGDFVTPKRIRTIQDLSIAVDPDVTSNFGEITATATEPWKSSTDKLFGEFLEAVHGQGSNQRAFEILENFIVICTNKLTFLQSLDPYKISSRDAVLSRVWLQGERNTWRLLYVLYQDRFNSQHDRSIDRNLRTDKYAHEMHVSDELPLEKQLSEMEIVKQLFRNNSNVRECQLVIDWLERNAADLLSDEYRITHCTDKTISWENTLHQLQNDISSIPFGSRRPIVSKIDPDAPYREGKSLHDLDMNDERQLLKDIFLEIRCGQLEEAQKLCVHCGQHWRAATFEGWRLYHDPNYDTVSETGEKLPVEGNPNRDVWKLCTYNMTNNKKMAAYARASYAAFCGNLAPLKEVSHSWEDLLWSYLKVRQDILVETEIRECSTRSYIALPDEYWKNKLELEDIFTELSSCKDKDIQKAAKSPVCLIQKYLILDDIPRLMNEMAAWVKQSDDFEASVVGSVLETGRKNAVACNPHFLRFLAHIVLFLRLIGRCSNKDVQGDAVLKAYIQVLVMMKEVELIAFYVSALPQEEQINIYAEFLETVTHPEQRKVCLTMAEYVGLDIETITKTVVENIRNKTSEESMQELNSEETEDDLKKISALEWVVSYPSQRTEAVWQANALIRHFIALKKFSAARKAFNKIPLDSVDLIMENYRTSYLDATVEDIKLPSKVSAAIREYLCIRTYLEAHEAFADWYRHFTNARPTSPECPTGDVPFGERVAYQEKLNIYKSEVDRWKRAMSQQTKTVKSMLYNVLTFPPYGWMKDAPETWDIEEQTEEIQNRERQMENLRQLCIPEIVILLFKVMHEMGEHAECLQLADIIASEQHSLYKVYTKQQLKELLDKIKECSLSLLNSKHDFWG